MLQTREVKRLRKIKETRAREQSSAGQILLDNDVTVDYDAPMISPLAKNEFKPINITKKLLVPKENEILSDLNETARVLKSNPNISMRELFPGEDELNLYINIPFTSSMSRTPEGWVRVQSILQYDEETRTLWEELQKPYGNQSSFLRHLVLLEKYFRSGDLVISNNASSNAITYADSMQNRIRSYDNSPSKNKPLSFLHSLDNSPITITPAQKTKKAKLGDLSSTKNHGDHSKAIELDTSDALKPENKSKKREERKQEINIECIAVPPSLNHQANTSMSPPKLSISGGGSQHLIKLPDTLTPTERKHTAKPWRPTLIPITSNSSEIINSGPLYQTADGRKLPGLVQVMSGGKPYHISIHDYNRMCILRREKLWQLQQQQRLQHSNVFAQDTLQKSTESPANYTVQIPNQILQQNSIIPINNINPKLNIESSQKFKKFQNCSSLIQTKPITSLSSKSFGDNSFSQMVSGTHCESNEHHKSFISTNTSTLSTHVSSNAWTWNDNINTIPNSVRKSDGSLIIDNSVLSKIPKSLTVIPQQRGQKIKDPANEDIFK